MTERLWEACWRIREADGDGGFGYRRVRARGRHLAQAVRTTDDAAWNGELRLTSPDGRTLWTDLPRLAHWSGDGDPEQRTDGLWLSDVRRSRRVGTFLLALDIAVADARRTGVIRPHDAAAIVAYAEELTERVRTLPGARRPPPLPTALRGLS